MFESLKIINTRYLFHKKNILVPSYLDGNTFKKKLTLKGFDALNLSVTTLFDLARDICFPILLENGWEILDSTIGQLMVLEILKELHFNEELSFFKLPVISSSFARSIFRIIKEIRVSGYTVMNFPHKYLPNSEKIKDIFLIMLRYEEKLKETKLIDEADLFRQAGEQDSIDDKTIFLIPYNIPMNELELRFFKKRIEPLIIPLSAKDQKIEIATQDNLTVFAKKTTEISAETIFDSLQYRKNINDLNIPLFNIEFCQTHGEYNEVREVLRRIMKGQLAYDMVQVFYTAQEPYSQYFYQLSQLYKIPITFHSGINIKNSFPAQFLFSILDWINDNFSINKLIVILSSPGSKVILKEPEELQKIIPLLRQSPIGWGRERYIPGFELAVEEREKRIHYTSDEKIIELSEEINYLLLIKEWIEKVFSEIPYYKTNSKISISRLAGGLLRLVRDYSNNRNNKIDEEALQIITYKLGILEKYSKLEYPVNEALALIRNIIESERVNCSSPLPGHLHIASYKKGIWIGRSNSFFVGMDYMRFPGITEDDTVLEVVEREKFNQQLVDKAQLYKMEEVRLLELVLSLRGAICLIFSGYDTITQRELAPANFMLQLYRLQKRDSFIDYNTFYKELNQIKGFIPQNSDEILDDGEYFLFFTNKENTDLQHLFLNKYVLFKEGIKAEKFRKEEGFNSYNGRINVDIKNVDPRENRGVVVSASKLERIAYCPYLYFLVDILKIKPLEEMVYDPTVWLNPMERGLLLHQIYEQFYRALINNFKGEEVIPSYETHWPLLEKIIEDCLIEKRRHLAPPGELVYQAERSAIIENGQIFLKEEEGIYNKYFNQPRYFELAFGTRDCEHEILGKVRSIELEFPDSRRVSIQGKIDRVDQMKDGSYRVIDYKTGRADDYKRNKPFRQGQQIQHALYAISFEKILNRKEKIPLQVVSDAGYYFPTVAGKGNLVLYGKLYRDQVLEIIKILLEIVAKGNFAMTKKADDFMCLEYKDIMEQNEVIVLNKTNEFEWEGEEAALKEIRSLQKYE